MKEIAFYGLCILSCISIQAQTYPVPVKVLDELIFETMKGRQCDSVRLALHDVIEKQGIELMHSGEVIRLKNQEVKSLDFINANWSIQFENMVAAFGIEIKTLKKKNGKKVLIIIVQGLVIVLLLI